VMVKKHNRGVLRDVVAKARAREGTGKKLAQKNMNEHPYSDRLLVPGDTGLRA